MDRTLRITAAAFALALCVATGLFAQASPVSATLVVPETRLLPGVPFEAWVELENRSGATLAVGLLVSLRVTTEDGTFEFRPDHPDLLRIDRKTGRAVHYIELASRARETLTLPVEDLLTGAAVFNDPRISEPGRYSLALRLDAWPAGGLGVEPPPSHFAGPVLTNEVSIERITPAGADAQVWARLQELAANAKVRWSPALWPANFELANEIVTYAGSGYVPYALLSASFGNAHKRHLELALDAIRRSPRSPVIDQLRFTTANVAEGLGIHDVAEAQRAFLRDSRKPTTRALVYGPEDPRRRVPDSRRTR